MIEVDLGGGAIMNFKFCSATQTIYGLKRFMKKYIIQCNYMLVFTYMGGWKFQLTVYDFLCGYHFRDEYGVLDMEEFEIAADYSVQYDLSSISGTLIEFFSNLKVSLLS